MAKISKNSGYIDSPDGPSEEDMARCKAIYNDPGAYRAWRERMGLQRPPERFVGPIGRVWIADRLKQLAGPRKCSDD